MTWPQNYDPLGFWPLSTALSAIPVLTLFFVLVVLRKRVWISAMCGFLAAVALALVIFRMPPVMVAGACLAGFSFGFFRIAWIIVASIFLYHVAVESGQFDVMKESIASLSSSKAPEAAARPSQSPDRSLSGWDSRHSKRLRSACSRTPHPWLGEALEIRFAPWPASPDCRSSR